MTPVPYEVVGLLGRGGMAVVELAVDPDGRRVARKRLPLTGSAAEMELARLRLRREAQLLARLEHPGIVPLLAVEDDGADVVMVMPALAASLADRVRTEGPLKAGEVWRNGRVLLDALVWAHGQGVVHRDIKPANVLFDAQGHPALADFGIARSPDATFGLTAVGSLLGTPEFIAPEQARGEPAGPPADVFSLGATLMFALTGSGPYGEGDPVTLAVKAARGEVRAELPGVPAALATPLRQMLDPDAARRPSAEALLGTTGRTRPGVPGHRVLPPAPIVVPRAASPAGPPIAIAGAVGAGTPPAPAPVAVPPARIPPARAPVAGTPGAGAPGAGEPASARGATTGPGHTLFDRGVEARTAMSAPAPAETAAQRDRPRRAGRPLPAPVRVAVRVLLGGPLRAWTRRRWITVAVLGVVVAVVASWVGVALAGRSETSPTAVGASAAKVCAPLPYQPCGQPTPAPHTDGLRCLPGWYDLDGVAADGCEATPDTVNGNPLTVGAPISANLVPVGDIDSYPVAVGDSSFLSCGSDLRVTLAGPAGVTDRVAILKGSKVLGEATSVDGAPATASTSKPSCLGYAHERLTVAVAAVSGTTGTDYTLTRTGGW